MEICKCITESKWFLSNDNDSTIYFEKGEFYKFDIEDCIWGQNHKVYHPDYDFRLGYSPERFSICFEIIPSRFAKYYGLITS